MSNRLIVEYTPQQLLEIVADVDAMDLPDGAHFAMLEELTGMDAIDVYTKIEDLQCDICGDYHEGKAPRECETGDGV